jgi:hypothetical protein
MPLVRYFALHCVRGGKQMNGQLHESPYRSAVDAAQLELRQIAEAMTQLSMRQQKIYAAAEALKYMVGAPDAVSAARRTASANPVVTMGNPNQQAARKNEKVQALA